MYGVFYLYVMYRTPQAHFLTVLEAPPPLLYNSGSRVFSRKVDIVNKVWVEWNYL